MSQTPPTDPASAPDGVEVLPEDSGVSPSTGEAGGGGGPASTGIKVLAAAAGATTDKAEQGGGTPSGG